MEQKWDSIVQFQHFLQVAVFYGVCDAAKSLHFTVFLKNVFSGPFWDTPGRLGQLLACSRQARSAAIEHTQSRARRHPEATVWNM